MRRATLSLTLLVLASCKYAAEPPDGLQLCGPEAKQCPSGYACAEGRCWKGSPPLAPPSVDTAAEGPPDACDPAACGVASCEGTAAVSYGCHDGRCLRVGQDCQGFGCEGTVCRTRCQAGQIRCADRCQPESVQACGEDCRSCPGGEHAACQDRRCACATGTIMCGDECKPCPHGCEEGECLPNIAGRWIPQEIGLLDVLIDLTQSGRVVHLSDSRGKDNIPGRISRVLGTWRLDLDRPRDLPPEWSRAGEIVGETRIIWWHDDPPIIWARQ
jgi:hypothetical protein